MTQHYRAFNLTPWRETVMLDADMIFTSSVDHWWPTMRLLDVCVTNNVYDYTESMITSRACRKLFDINLLPNAYGAFMYFRYTMFSNDFFQKMKQVTENWNWFADSYLIKNENPIPRLDEILAITTRVVGIEKCMLPISIPTFVHAKNELLNLTLETPWYEQVYVEWDGIVPIIDHFKQRLPLHYHYKEFVTDDIIRNFERHYKESNQSNTRI